MTMKYSGFVIMTSILFLCCCNGNYSQKERSDYYFRIDEMNMNVITSKRAKGKFYVMFSQKDTIAPTVDDSIDYVLFETDDMCPINIIFDPDNKKDIYIQNSGSRCLSAFNQVNYNLKIMDEDNFLKSFYYPQIKTQPRILKYPFLNLTIFPMSYRIITAKYEIQQKVVKDGDMYGGW